MKSTVELVHEMADKLVQEGVRPSQQVIRERLGKGSATTIHKALNQWWANLAARLQQPQTSVPEPIVRQVDALWQEALQRARHEMAEQAEALKAQYQDKQAEISQQSQASQEKLESLAASLSSAYARLDELQRELNDSQKESLKLERNLIKTQSQLTEAERENKTNIKLIQQLESKLASTQNKG